MMQGGHCRGFDLVRGHALDDHVGRTAEKADQIVDQRSLADAYARCRSLPSHLLSAIGFRQSHEWVLRTPAA